MRDFLKSLDFVDPWDRFNLVRIEFPSKLPQELRQIIEHVARNESQSLGKINFNTFV